jgi:hypothetical protein
MIEAIEVIKSSLDPRTDHPHYGCLSRSGASAARRRRDMVRVEEPSQPIDADDHCLG